MAQPLVTTQWVADNKNSVRLIEVDVDTTQYEQGHIPGAVAFNWQTQLQNQTTRDIASPEEFAALLSQASVTSETHVVLYGDNNNWFAAYAFWLFQYYGHTNISLLDGGRKKWIAEGRETTTDVPTYPATSYTVTTINHHLRADRDYIKQRLEKQGFGLVDVRSNDEYTGKIIAPPGMTETAQRPGHIPGAANIPWAQAVAEDGSFKSKEELTKLYGNEGHQRGRARRGGVLPHRRTLVAHVVRAQVHSRLRERAQLRRLVDRMGQPDRRADPQGRTAVKQQ